MEKVNLDDLAYKLHQTAKSKGFYDSLDMSDFNSQAKQLAMIHSEVTEVLEALRKSKGEKAVVEELDDILIRVLDFWYALYDAKVINTSLHDVLGEKARINEGRDKMHGVKG